MKKFFLILVVAVTICASELTGVSADKPTYYAQWTVPQGGNAQNSYESTPKNSVSLFNAVKLHKIAAISATSSGIGETLFVGNYAYQLRQANTVKIDLVRKVSIWTTNTGGDPSEPFAYYSGRLYVASNDTGKSIYKVSILDANSGHLIKVLDSDSYVSGLLVTNGRLVIANSTNIRLYNTATLTQISTINFSPMPGGLAMSSTSLYASQYDTSTSYIIHIYALDNAHQTKQFILNNMGANITFGNNMLIATDGEGNVLGYNSSGKLLWTNNTHLTLLTLTAIENNHLFLLSTTGKLLIINAANGANIFNISISGNPYGIMLSNNIAYLTSGLTVRMVNATNGKFMNTKLTVGNSIHNDSIMQIVPLGSNTIATVSVGLDKITIFSV